VLSTCKGERERGFRVSTNKEEHRFIYPLGCLGFDGIILGKYNYYLSFVKNINLITLILFYFIFIFFHILQKEHHKIYKIKL
jgi:hypothetical protein